ncbi:MAG: hypothetical protein L0H64_24020, partial [Pseudonocardia sp.]|nr:hypothetical protein [Pseudonocardia sp.]
GGGTFVYFRVDGLGVGGYTEAGLTTPTLATVRFQSEFSSDDPAAFAHPIVSAYADYIGTRSDLAYVATGHDGENPVTRLSRLCAEEGVPVTVTGTSAAAMGPQFPDTFLGLIRECEATEHGILYDGVGAGLAYVTRTERENRAVDLTVDVPAGDLAAEFAPVDDDQRNVNRAVAEQREGTAATYTDLDGPLGVATIGLYDTSLAVNAADADSVADYAGWAVHLGTVEGYRYPSVTADLRAAPGLAGGWLAAGPSSRITVADPGSALTGHPSGDVDLLVEGTVQEITPFRWSATAQCSAYNPWRIVVLAADVGDTDPHLCHLDTAAAELAAPAAAGASTLSVATTTGPVWTTAADDTPFVVEVGGVAVEVTAVVGAASPQTFTVTPATVTRALPAGAVVRVHRPTALAL